MEVAPRGTGGVVVRGSPFRRPVLGLSPPSRDLHPLGSDSNPFVAGLCSMVSARCPPAGSGSQSCSSDSGRPNDSVAPGDCVPQAVLWPPPDLLVQPPAGPPLCPGAAWRRTWRGGLGELPPRSREVGRLRGRGAVLRAPGPVADPSSLCPSSQGSPVCPSSSWEDPILGDQAHPPQCDLVFTDHICNDPATEQGPFSSSEFPPLFRGHSPTHDRQVAPCASVPCPDPTFGCWGCYAQPLSLGGHGG